MRYFAISILIATVFGLRSETCHAYALLHSVLIEVHSVGGVFVNPVGGITEGVGTRSVTTGSPQADRYTILMLDSLPPVMLYQPFVAGYLTLENDIAQLGTTFNKIDLIVRGQMDVHGVNAFGKPIDYYDVFWAETKIVTSIVTENITGDPVQDGDFVLVQDFNRSLLVPEREFGRVELIARIEEVPDASPLAAISPEGRSVAAATGEATGSYVLRLIGFGEASGIVVVANPTSIPEPSVLAIVALSIGASCLFRRGSRPPVIPGTAPHE